MHVHVQLALHSLARTQNAKRLTAVATVQNWEDRRHLLRLWVSPQTDRPLPEVYANLWGNIEPGNRGGLKGMGNVPTIPMEAE